jgi:hypothetical protein
MIGVFADAGCNVIETELGADMVDTTSSATVTDFEPEFDHTDMGRLFDPTGAGDDTPAEAASKVEIALPQGKENGVRFTLVTFSDHSAAGATNGNIEVRLDNVTPDQLTAANFTTYTSINSPVCPCGDTDRPLRQTPQGYIRAAMKPVFDMDDRSRLPWRFFGANCTILAHL